MSLSGNGLAFGGKAVRGVYACSTHRSVIGHGGGLKNKKRKGNFRPSQKAKLKKRLEKQDQARSSLSLNGYSWVLDKHERFWIAVCAKCKQPLRDPRNKKLMIPVENDAQDIPDHAGQDPGDEGARSVQAADEDRPQEGSRS